MDLKTFVSAHRGVHSAKHGDGFIYIGRDQADRWWMSWKEEDTVLDCGIGEKNFEKAKAEAHAQVDGGKTCTLKLKWTKAS
jgi:hypothetical protein